MPIGRILVQFHIVNANYLAPVNVDDLLIEQVACEKKQAFRSVGNRPGRSRSINLQAAIHRVHRAEWHYPIARFGAHDQHGNPRRILLWSNRQFAHMSGLTASRIENRPSQQFGERYGGHRSERIPNCGTGSERFYLILLAVVSNVKFGYGSSEISTPYRGRLA